MDGVLSLDWRPLPHYPEELTLLGMEAHEPLLFPSLGVHPSQIVGLLHPDESGSLCI